MESKRTSNTSGIVKQIESKRLTINGNNYLKSTNRNCKKINNNICI